MEVEIRDCIIDFRKLFASVLIDGNSIDISVSCPFDVSLDTLKECSDLSSEIPDLS